MNRKTLCYLDGLRFKAGDGGLKSFFNNTANGAELLNDNRLLFYTLFVLMPEIDEQKLYNRLSPRNISALKICSKILKMQLSDIDSLPSESEHEALRWMLDTGRIDGFHSGSFEKILDGAAALLVITYNDKEVLPAVAEMAFERNRRGEYIHDLVWVLFQSHDPVVLKLIAGYLRSADKKNVELAGKLLNLIDVDSEGTGVNRKRLYKSSVRWLEDNYPYIYFTGENFQQTTYPKHCGVDLQAKYLAKSISPDSGNPNQSYTEDEHKSLECFAGVDNNEKEILSDFSNKMHGKNIDLWNSWIKRPMHEQIDIAKGRLSL